MSIVQNIGLSPVHGSALPPPSCLCAVRSEISRCVNEISRIFQYSKKMGVQTWWVHLKSGCLSSLFVNDLCFPLPIISVKISPEKCPHFRQTHHIQKGKGAENIFDNYREISLLPLLVVCSACVTRSRWMVQCLQCVPGWPHVHIFTICRARNLLRCGRHSRLGR